MPEHKERLELLKPARAKWVDDDASQSCMLCGAQFSFTNRRHHCRKCGLLVCGDCSKHHMYLPHHTVMKRVRVCDICHRSLSDTSNSAGLEEQSLVPAMDSKETLECDIAIEHPVLPSSNQLPSWMYFFKPFSEEGQRVGIGELRLTILRGADLPALDFFGTSDPYCVVKVGPETCRTSVINRTLNPIWDQSFVLEVANTTDNLVIDVFDHDQLNSDDPMGSIEISLSQLSHRSEFEGWFELKLVPKVEEDFLGVNVRMRPRILLRYQYKYSKVGEFVSQFIPQPPPPAEEEVFNVDVCYSLAMQALCLIQPLLDFAGFFTTILFWQRIWLSMTSLIFICWLCLYPRLIPICVESGLITLLIWEYVHKKFRMAKQFSQHPIAIAKEDSPEKHSRQVNPLLLQEEEDIPQAHLNKLLRSLANTSLSASGFQELLRWYQWLLKQVVWALVLIDDIVTWKYHQRTLYVFIALCAALLYSLFFPFEYILFFLVFYITTMYTVPTQTCTVILSGIVSYLCQSKLDPAQINQKWHSLVGDALELRRKKTMRKNIKRGSTSSVGVSK